MSKIPVEKMRSAIIQMLADRKERKFVETVDLQIGLKDYDPNKDKRLPVQSDYLVFQDQD